MEQHKERIQKDVGVLCEESSEFPAKEKLDDFEKMARFLCSVGQLKSILRTGWIIPGREIDGCERVSGHMYRMGIMSMLFEGQSIDGPTDDKSKQLNINKMIRMSLLHDMPEAIVGDVTPFDGITEDEKHRKESQAMAFMVSMLPEEVANKMKEDYVEYETRESDESKIVKELDRFDIMVQAFQYERQQFTNSGRIVRFDEFFAIVNDHVRHPMLVKIKDRYVQERANFYETVIAPTVNALAEDAAKVNLSTDEAATNGIAA